MTLTEAQRQLKRASEQQLENHLATRLQQLPGIPAGWQRQYRWHPTRQFRADFAWPEQRLLVEVDGGTYAPGRLHSHATGAGIGKDMMKANEAQLLGWSLLRFDVKMVEDDVAVEVIARWFRERETT